MNGNQYRNRARSHESSSAPKTKASLLSRGTLLHVGVQGVIIGLLGGPGAVWVPRSALFEGLALWPAEPPPPTRPGLVGDLADVVLDMVRLPQCALAAVVGRRPVARTCGGGGGAVGLCRGTCCAAVVPLCAVACAPSAPATLPERAQRCGPLGHAWSRPLGRAPGTYSPGGHVARPRGSHAGAGKMTTSVGQNGTSVGQHAGRHRLAPRRGWSC
eukprot:scaffold53549_cov60-Phaeocystis_antarctica.AAC.3